MNETQVTNRVREYLKTSGILWIVIGILQVIALVTIIAGAWNIYAGITRYKLAGRIQPHRRWIISEFENSLNSIILIAVINLILGGVIGIAFAGFDYYIRDYVLKNRAVFS